jgi:hypothetical protein
LLARIRLVGMWRLRAQRHRARGSQGMSLSPPTAPPQYLTLARRHRCARALEHTGTVSCGDSRHGPGRRRGDTSRVSAPYAHAPASQEPTVVPTALVALLCTLCLLLPARLAVATRAWRTITTAGHRASGTRHGVGRHRVGRQRRVCRPVGQRGARRRQICLVPAGFPGLGHRHIRQVYPCHRPRQAVYVHRRCRHRPVGRLYAHVRGFHRRMDAAPAALTLALYDARKVEPARM